MKSREALRDVFRTAVTLAVISLILSSDPVRGEEDRLGRFQLWNNCHPVSLLVEGLSSDAGEIGLIKNRIQTTVESRLRGARIYKGDADAHTPTYLYAQVSVLGSAFSFTLEYNKVMTDPASLLTGFVTTWQKGATGTHSGDAGYIIQLLSEQTDEFVNEYLRVNEAACK